MGIHGYSGSDSDQTQKSSLEPTLPLPVPLAHNLVFGPLASLSPECEPTPPFLWVACIFKSTYKLGPTSDAQRSSHPRAPSVYPTCAHACPVIDPSTPNDPTTHDPLSKARCGSNSAPTVYSARVTCFKPRSTFLDHFLLPHYIAYTSVLIFCF